MGLIRDLKKEGKRIEQFSGTAGATATEHFASNSRKVIEGIEINNDADNNELQISVDGGTVFHKVSARGSYDLENDARSFLVKRTSGDAAYTGRIAVQP